MNTIKSIWYWLLTGFLFVVILLLSFTSIKSCVNNKKLKASNAELNVKLQACVNAPETIIERVDTVIIRTGGTFHPNPVTSNSPPRPDTVYLSDSNIHYYDDLYQEDSVSIRWKAKVCGIIDSMQFAEIMYPLKTVTKTRTVDTCILKPPIVQHVPKNHVVLGVSLFANSFEHFPGVCADLTLSFKDKWGISGGALYDTYNNQIYAKVGVVLYLK